MKTFKEIALTQIGLNEATVDYDLQKRYDYFNKKLFDNKLPKIPLKFRRTKKAGGAVKLTYMVKGSGRRKRVTSYEIQELYLSTFMLRTKEQMDQIMVHEMIHIWLAENGYHEGYNVQLHGNEFVTKKNELQAKVKFDIPMADYLESEVRDKKNKEYGVILVRGKLGTAVAVIKKEVLEAKIENLKEMLTRSVQAGSEIIFGISNNPELEAFPMKRTIKSISLFVMKKSIEDAVMDNITVLYKEQH